MESSGEEEDIHNDEDVEPKKRGRPPGSADQKPRYRRTAEQISADKLAIAQMKLDALRESEERKLTNKKTRVKTSPAEKPPAEKPPKVTKKTKPPSPKRSQPRPQSDSSDDKSPPKRFGRQSLYDSWFPPSPRGRKTRY